MRAVIQKGQAKYTVRLIKFVGIETLENIS